MKSHALLNPLLKKLVMNKILFGSIMVIVVLFMTLILYEIALRLFFPAPQLLEIRTFSTEGARGPAMEIKPNRSGGLYVETEKGRRLRPNMNVKIMRHFISGLDVTVETNSLGFRNRELESKSVKRILFLGDSITLSDYLDDSDTFVRRVESLSFGRTEPLETVNAGVSGESLQNYFDMLNETGLSIEPDVVVVGVYLNDFQPSRSVRLFYPPEFLHGSWAANYVFHVFSKKFAKLTRA